MRHWTRHFTLQYSKVGQALNASNAEINKEFQHENIRGILLAETSGLTSSEFASVVATSGTTGAEGESIGNSWKFSHLVQAFCAQWCDAALGARDARKSEAVVAAVDNFSPLLRKVENRQVWVHLAFCQKHRAHLSTLVLRCPRSVRLRLVQLVVDHIMLLVSVLISACSVSSWRIRHGTLFVDFPR